MNLFVDRHVAVLDEADVVPNMTPAFDRFERDPGCLRRRGHRGGPERGCRHGRAGHGRYDSVANLEDYEGLKDEARTITQDAIERLPELIDRLRETVETNGGTVYVAEDEADANQYMREMIGSDSAKTVVKSKSMTSEEIDVNQALEADGHGVVETDLGEWALQVADEAPSHIVARPSTSPGRPSRSCSTMCLTRGALETAQELTRFARDKLDERIREAGVGMTGANFVTADTGTIALVTSEGNARKTVAATDTYVVVAGLEKIVSSVEDLQPFVELIGRSGTGQDITSYVSLFTPPVGGPVVDFHDDETPLSAFDDDL